MQISFQPIKLEDMEKIFQLQKELIERYEDLSSINCEKVFAWCKKKDSGHHAGLPENHGGERTGRLFCAAQRRFRRVGTG